MRKLVVSGVIAGVVVACSGPGLEAMGGVVSRAGSAVAGVGGSLSSVGRRMAGSGGRAGASGASGADEPDAAIAGREEPSGQVAGRVGSRGSPSSAGASSIDEPGGSSGAYAGGALGVAGRMLGAAGAVLASAGHAVAEAGRSIADAGHAGLSGGRAQENMSDGLPRPHWILRDRSGEPVRAEVYPAYPAKYARFSRSSASCVMVQHLGDREIGLPYALSSGQLAAYADCPYGFADAGSWRDSAIAYFLDSDCETQPVSIAVRYTITVAGVHYYSDGSGGVSTPATYFRWDKGSAQCTAIPNPSSSTELWAWKPIPSEALNLLPNAPYSLELVY